MKCDINSITFPASVNINDEDNKNGDANDTSSDDAVEENDL